MKKLRIVFFGTPDFAVASLKALVEAGFDVQGVVTAPDKPSGRGYKLQASPVKQYALSAGLHIMQPTNLKSDDFLRELAAINPDLQVVVAFRMLPEQVWNLPPLGTYNVHASLLPHYRGAAPIHWAVMNGEHETGVTTFKLQHEIDTGNILLQQKVPIGPEDTTGTMHDKLMMAGAELLVKSIQQVSSGNYTLRPQEQGELLKKAPKIFKEDCLIRWTQTAERVHDFIRGLNPQPGAFAVFTTGNGTQEPRKIFKTALTGMATETHAGEIKLENHRLFVSCADSWLEILELQPPGKGRLTAAEFLRGLRGDIGKIAR